MMARWRTGLDVRRHGSGHAGATNVMRVAGWAPGVAVLLWDTAKGYLVIKLAGQFPDWWLVPAVGAAAVIGHCWPILAGFRGGMGVATSGGALLAIWPLGFVLGVGLDAAFTLVLRHAARANIATGLTLWLLLLLFGAPTPALLLAAAVGLIVVLRSSKDWNRQYRELWLDRESGEAE
jgi:glycerol-3-phosphate acyltransferase PlsY